MSCLVLLKFKMLLVLFVIFHTIAVDPGVVWTDGVEGTKNEKKNLNDQTETSRRDAEVICELSDPPKIYPGGYLFEISIGVKFEGGSFKKFEGIEKRIARSIETLIKHQLSTFSPSLKKLLLRGVQRIDAPGLLLIYWLYFQASGEDIYIPLESQINQLLKKNVANLRHGKAILFSKSVEDVDECSSGLSVCGPKANCFNAFGFYSCQCTEGFEDHSLNASGTNCVENVKSEMEGLLSGIIFSVSSCHVTIRGSSGEFFSPAYPNTYYKYIWCNWTISAVQRKWIELQIHGFISQEDCNQNRDKIIIQESAHVIRHVLQACLNKTCHDIVVRASTLYLMFFSQGNLNNSTRHFHVKYQVYEDSQAPAETVLRSPAFKKFQCHPTDSVDTETVVNQTLHGVQSKNLLHSEATKPILQGYRREQSESNSLVFTQLTTRTSTMHQSAAGSEDLSNSEHSRVQIPAKPHVSSFAGIHLWNILFIQPPTRSYQPPLFTTVEFTRLFGPLRPLVPRPDFPDFSSLKSNIDPQMCLATPECLKSQMEDNGDVPSTEGIPEQSRFERNLATCQWQIGSYSATSGFWFSTTAFRVQEIPAPLSIQTDFLRKQQVENYSPHTVEQGSACRLIAESQSQIVYKSVALIESDQMEFGGSSAHSVRLTGLLKLFDSTEGRREMQSISIFSLNGLSGWITICGIAGDYECEDFEHIKTQPLMTSLPYGYMQSKSKPHVLYEPEGPMQPANDEMKESALNYSDSFDVMSTLLLTPSLNSYLWMKMKSQNSYTAEGFTQTSIYQTLEPEPQLIVPTHVDMSSKANSNMMTISKFLIYEVEWQTPSLWMFMSFNPSLDAAQRSDDATTNLIDGPLLLDTEYPMEPSAGSPTLTWTTLGPKPHDDIGHLLAVSAVMKLVNVVYKNFQYLEKKVLQSVKALIMDNLASFSPPLKKILIGDAKRINSSGLAFEYQLYFGQNGENIYHTLQIQMNKLLNKLLNNR
ncbi:uncharacterized protein zgc:66455 [Scyliorhinus canicula]|uniref:uncharacterized protein zgc:66455 n=1 Tax=Scyliorhinus canicula TaxID=7830 RepID=UPI0018F5488B|nr:uncharacterized protein zgc:66455 [Scyliorhinus canicula]XP_038663805.1 uncharacterized protein zgc:66455 [Scyliorhinus canicula]